jgi:competence protein ComEA
MFFSRQEVVVLGLCGVVLTACAGWWIWQARTSTPVPLAAPPFLSEAKPSALAESVRLTVHVAGRVKSPGVYRFRPGQRVHEALKVAGGSLPDADLDEVNLAATLRDGEKVYLPPIQAETAPAPGRAPKSGGASAKPSPDWLAAHPINANTATEQKLQLLPGVGPVTAAKIVQERRANGPFRTVDELVRVKGIGEKTLEKLRKYVRV